MAMFYNTREEQYLFNLIKAVAKENPQVIEDMDNLDDLIQTATSEIGFGDIDEFCKKVGISPEWYDEYFYWDEQDGEFYAKR